MIRLNKRGQGASSSETTGWILALLVLVVVALVVWFMFSYFKDTAEIAPDELQRAAAYCENSPFASNVGQYCNDYKEFDVSGNKVYYNCAEIKELSGNDRISSNVCDESHAENYCRSLMVLGKIEVNKAVKIGKSGSECSIKVEEGNEVAYFGTKKLSTE